MKVAIMQPYAFPYIGYFCLAQASDVFVFYDDVNFIPRGWINRNRILINGIPYKFTIPLSNGSQNELICDVKTHEFAVFRNKFLKQIRHSYGKAPYFEVGFNYIDAVLKPDHETIADLAVCSIERFFELIGIDKKFIRSSGEFQSSRGIDKADRLIAITKALAADGYVNAIGGVTLYEKPYFLERGVTLSFVKPELKQYRQIGSTEFAAGLSIIDVLMNNNLNEVISHVKSYELV